MTHLRNVFLFALDYCDDPIFPPRGRAHKAWLFIEGLWAAATSPKLVNDLYGEGDR